MPRMGAGALDKASSFFLCTQRAMVGKEQRIVGKWRKESGYDYGIFLAQVLDLIVSAWVL